MLWENQVLVIALTAWSLAQILKVPIEFWRSHKWDWALLFTAGGMPSSHSALVTAAAHAIGLYLGFNSPLYALAVVVTMIVVYDATGIRRQAGRHAEMINAMMYNLMQGHPLQEQQLREVLGHTPLQAFMGILLGLSIAQIFYAVW